MLIMSRDRDRAAKLASRSRCTPPKSSMVKHDSELQQTTTVHRLHPYTYAGDCNESGAVHVWTLPNTSHPHPHTQDWKQLGPTSRQLGTHSTPAPWLRRQGVSCVRLCGQRASMVRLAVVATVGTGLARSGHAARCTPRRSPGGRPRRGPWRSCGPAATAAASARSRSR